MEANVARVAASAASMLRRMDSLERVASFGQMVREWSARSKRGDAVRRMTMGGAEQTAVPAPAFMDAFCAVQLTPRSSMGKDAVLSPMASLTLALPSTMATSTNLDGMMTPTASGKLSSLSPMTSGVMMGEPLASSKSKVSADAFQLCHPVA